MFLILTSLPRYCLYVTLLAVDMWFRSEHSGECLYETWLRWDRWGRAVGRVVVVILRFKLNVVLRYLRILAMTLVLDTRK